MIWFKLYSEARNDAKLRSLDDAQHRIWFNLLCFASEQPERGTIRGYSLHHLAVEVDAKAEEMLVTTLNALQALQCVTVRYTENKEPEIAFVKFAERQKQKPSDDRVRVRERVAKHRKKKSSGKSSKSSVGNAVVTRCNASETRQELELELELEENKIRANSRPPAPTYACEEPLPTARPPDDADDVPDGPGYRAALEVVRTTLGDAAAKKVGYEIDTVGPWIRARWDCLAAAAVEVRQKMDQRNGQPIRNPYGLMLSIAQGYSLKDGPPPPPVVVPPRPKDPTPGYAQPLVISDRARARVANAKPPARGPAPPKTGTGA